MHMNYREERQLDRQGPKAAFVSHPQGRLPHDERAAGDRPPRHAAQARRARRRPAEGRLPADRSRTVQELARAGSRRRRQRARSGGQHRRERRHHVTLSYRGDAFARAKPKNRERIAAAERAGRLRVLLESDVRRIDASRVILECDGRDVELPNDAVIVSAGGILPTDFLRSADRRGDQVWDGLIGLPRSPRVWPRCWCLLPRAVIATTKFPTRSRSSRPRRLSARETTVPRRAHCPSRPPKAMRTRSTWSVRSCLPISCRVRIRAQARQLFEDAAGRGQARLPRNGRDAR